MLRAQRSSEGASVRGDLIEAGLQSGFALIHLAETQSRRDRARSLREALSICRESERRVARLQDTERRRFRDRIAHLRGALARAGSSNPADRVVQMPAR